MEETFVMIKPDGVQRGLLGEIIHRLEQKGLQMKACKLMQITDDLARTHYGEHQGKPFFEGLVSFITSGPVLAMVWQGPSAVSVVRRLMGQTDGREAAPGTIRGDFGLDVGYNLVHGSDSRESAEREIDLFFDPEEQVQYDAVLEPWLFEH